MTDRYRQALEDIRSRSAMNLTMRPDPVALTARLGDIYQIADAALSNGEVEMSDRSLTTHGHDCWNWGPKHYECAVREIKRLHEQLRLATVDQAAAEAEANDAHAENKRLTEALEELITWIPSADTYRRLGFDPEAPMRVLRKARATLAKLNGDDHETKET